MTLMKNAQNIADKVKDEKEHTNILLDAAKAPKGWAWTVHLTL